MGVVELAATVLSIVLLAVTFPLSLFFCFKVSRQFYYVCFLDAIFLAKVLQSCSIKVVVKFI